MDIISLAKTVCAALGTIGGFLLGPVKALFLTHHQGKF
jgi:hypothetical protein